MKQASVVRYYFARYFFLGFGLLLIAIGGLLYLRQGDYLKGQMAAYLFLTLGLVFISLFLTVASKLRRVAIRKKKISVLGAYKTQCYDWDEIKSLKLIPGFNMYCMKIKGKKRKVYFLPPQKPETVYGLFQPSSEFALRKEKN